MSMAGLVGRGGKWREVYFWENVYLRLYCKKTNLI